MEVVDIKNEYATQFFGFQPAAFTDSVYNVMLDATLQAVGELKESLLKDSKCYDENKLSEKCDALTSVLMNHGKIICDKLEKYLCKNVFNIPENVVLPQDQVHLRPDVTSTTMEKVDATIHQLTLEIKQESTRIARLNNRKKEIDKLIESFKDAQQLADEVWEKIQPFEEYAARANAAFQLVEEVVQGLDKMDESNDHDKTNL